MPIKLSTPPQGNRSTMEGQVRAAVQQLTGKPLAGRKDDSDNKGSIRCFDARRRPGLKSKSSPSLVHGFVWDLERTALDASRESCGVRSAGDPTTQRTKEEDNAKGTIALLLCIVCIDCYSLYSSDRHLPTNRLRPRCAHMAFAWLFFR